MSDLTPTERAAWARKLIAGGADKSVVQRGIAQSGHLAIPDGSQIVTPGDLAAGWVVLNPEQAKQQTEDVDDRIRRLRAAATDVRLKDAESVGHLLDDATEALRDAYTELERAEQHHRWHHEQEGREVEEDYERLRVLMVIAEALESLGDEEPLAGGSAHDKEAE